jgi:ABC-2 type transport system ATP-binding protein
MPFIIHRESSGDKGYVTLSNFEDDLPVFMTYLKSKSITLRHMECRRKTLDDLFVSLTGRKINE